MSKYQDSARARAAASMPGFSKGPDPVAPPKANGGMARASDMVTARSATTRPIPRQNYAAGGKVMKHDDAKQDKAQIKALVKPSAIKPGMKMGGKAAPVKLAVGGAAKVRHGVATPAGAPKNVVAKKSPRYNT